MLTKLKKKLLSFVASQRNKRQEQNKKDGLYYRFSENAEKIGLDRLYVILSFDCDTPRDIPAAEKLFSILQKKKIKTTFCVPGKLLLEGANTYKNLAGQGAMFINHGGAHHTSFSDGSFRSVTFYDQMSKEEIHEDIQSGHRIFQSVFGFNPTGFRAPHFGNFQQLHQRQVIYEVIRKLDYKFSSSSMPQLAFENGPLILEDDIFEIPLSGPYQNPFSILDSWNYVESPENPILKPEYANLFIETLEYFRRRKLSGILNFYVDPAHVISSSAYFKTIDYLTEHNIPTLNFDDLISMFSGYFHK